MELFRQIYYSNVFRYIITPAIGFGVAGALWGWDIFRGAAESTEAFINPFSFISGAFLFGILGSLSLVLFSGDLKKIGKVVGVGIVGWILAFLLPGTISHYLFIFGQFIILIPGFFIEGAETIEKFTVLKPSVFVVDYGLFSLFSGLIIGLIYSLILRGSRKKIIISSGLGFALGFWVVPIVGNSINIFLNSLFITYLITFSLIGGILGLALARSLQKASIHD